MTEVGGRIVSRLRKNELALCGIIVDTQASNKEIAEICGTTEQAIRNTCKRIYDKVGVENKLQLVIALLKHGVIEMQAIQSKETENHAPNSHVERWAAMRR